MEPRLRLDVAARADLVTPHIAGYSYQGRVRGTHQCYEAACRFFERDPTWQPGAASSHALPPIHVEARGRDPEEVLDAVVRAAYDVEKDDRALRAGLAADDLERGRHFQRLRSEYPDRHEFPAWNVELAGADAPLRDRVRALGFRLAT